MNIENSWLRWRMKSEPPSRAETESFGLHRIDSTPGHEAVFIVLQAPSFGPTAHTCRAKNTKPAAVW